MKKIGIAIGISIVSLLLIGGLVLRNQSKTPDRPGDEAVGCTMEAKLCPNGSAVGRTGPNCEFPDCASDLPLSQPEQN